LKSLVHKLSDPSFKGLLCKTHRPPPVPSLIKEGIKGRAVDVEKVIALLGNRGNYTININVESKEMSHIKLS